MLGNSNLNSIGYQAYVIMLKIVCLLLRAYGAVKFCHSFIKSILPSTFTIINLGREVNSNTCILFDMTFPDARPKIDNFT